MHRPLVEEFPARELAHAVQQSRPLSGPVIMRKPADGGPAPALPLVPTPSLAGADCAATAGASFESQPAPLQATLRHSFGDRAPAWFDGLGARRHILTSIYIRLCQYGLWGHVVTVGDVHSGERPFLGFDIPGSTGAVDFTTADKRALIAATLNTFRFCADHGLGASQHQGAPFREVGQSDSLHITVGPGSNHFDAHIDRYSPVAGGAGGLCVYDPTAAAAHIGREVIPPKIRSRIGIPGVEVFPEPSGASSVPGAPESAPPPILGITWRF